MLLALFFGTMVQLCGPLSRGGVAGLIGLLASLPLSQELVLELRPEYGYAVLVGIGMILALRGESTPRRRDAVFTGAVWGSALLIKPPYAALTLALAGYAVVAEEWLCRRTEGAGVGEREARKQLAIKVAVLGLLAVPVLVRWRYYFDYVYANSYGEQAALWTLHGGFWERLLFQVAGPGGQRHLGAWLPVVVALAGLGSLYVAACEPAAVRRRSSSPSPAG